MRRNLVAGAAFLVVLAVPMPASAERLVCESRNFERNYCATGQRISGVRLVHQRSRARCAEGRTWGYDNGGIWVTDGCSGEFEFKRSSSHRPPPARGRQIACASRNFEQQYCPSERRIVRARLIEQRSRAACAQGRSWGFDDRGIWVSAGCSGLFAVEEDRRRPPPRPVNSVECQSRDYRYAFCRVGPVIRRAWLDEQLSQSPCIEGDTWGLQPGGVWVDRGCSGVFAYDVR
jgi:hypothetical protein